MSGGWLSLLAATLLIDMHQDPGALAYLRTAAQLAREAGHPELAAWCAETRAWQALTAGGYRDAVDLSRAAQQIAPRRAALARLDLALALTASGRDDEAAAAAMDAVNSGRLAPVDRPRVRERASAVLSNALAQCRPARELVAPAAVRRRGWWAGRGF